MELSRLTNARFDLAVAKIDLAIEEHAVATLLSLGLISELSAAKIREDVIYELSLQADGANYLLEAIIQSPAYGSMEEWDALSSEEKDAEWEDFQDRCARGVADEMYFYRRMMDMHLADYVGD